jgi:hypothetical protein
MRAAELPLYYNAVDTICNASPGATTRSRALSRISRTA